VEYADQCFCGNALENGGGPAPDGSTYCNMACAGNANETCGGPNRLDLYQLNGTSASATSTTSASSTTGPSGTVTASSTTTSGPIPTDLPTNWTYEGCYIDNANGRILAYSQPDDSSLTIESCIATCIGLGYSVAGAEYSVQCFCDDFIRNGGQLTSNSDCNMPCGGDSAEFCGAGNRLSIYSNATLQIYQPPAVQKTDLPGSWTYQGCLTDNQGDRTFPYQLEFENNNTATNCLSQCQLFGYGAGGMEYGQQCCT
jgi:hypothetical protein